MEIHRRERDMVMNMAAARTQRKARLRVSAAVGLHARPAVMLVKVAQNFDAEIEIALDGKKVSAKSILGVLTLGAEYGTEVGVTAEGGDAAEAVTAIEELFACGFHEEPGRTEHATTTRTSRRIQSPEGKGELILLADDEEGIRQTVSVFLGRNGYRVLLARNGAEAVELFNDNQDQVGAVILDMMMPKMNGDDAMRAIRRLRPGVPVLTVSGSMDSPPFTEDKVTAFLRKPFGMPDVLLTLRALLYGGTVGSHAKQVGGVGQLACR